jgi:hypothetical protein
MGIFVLSYGVAAVAIIAPLTQYNFGYWFNHGQPPHTARISFIDILNEFLYTSQWIKFYLFLAVLLAVFYFRGVRRWLTDLKAGAFFLLTLGILAEATVLQITSYTPPDNNIFFHSFAVVFILHLLVRLLDINTNKRAFLLPAALGLLLIWSGSFWNYAQRILQRYTPAEVVQNRDTSENVVNRFTYMIGEPSKEIPPHQWTFSSLPSFKRIYMPQPTVNGIDRLMQMPQIKDRQQLSVLNMTELTPLAAELPYQSEKGLEVPLWHHLGVAMFNKDAAAYERKIAAKTYEVALFEYIPSLNNFYPFRVRDSLYKHYQKVDSFPAPRRGHTQGMIEVFIPR